MAWVLDLDGVVWLDDQPLPGAAAAVGRLRSAGERVVFVTNNSSVRLADQEAKLARFGIPAAGDVVTSAVVAAGLVEAGERVFVCAGPGVEEAVRARGAEPVRDGDADAVLVGFHRDFDYDELDRASRAVRRGARLVGTNDDATYPTPAGLLPGGGAILAAVATASGTAPVVAGKPYPPMAEHVRALVGGHGVAVGDRPDTDGRFARALGFEWLLVLSGVTGRDDLPVDPAPDRIAEDLAAAVDAALSAPPSGTMAE
ncbi:MAG: HAD-IIA family hydrolase [Acidimicrobiales bacterium]|nr:HAD-IIA family hydrolase [Acidimicrobiales bacterium]MCB1016549.1 HAD-IIA family hydrolase [Acidimicrobiales bacterium]MCB9371358.1 HAD-IIA family hydrolase [Microthrixaceae bacterium]